MLGFKIKKTTSKVIGIPLFASNIFINDINIKKLNIDISNQIIKNCCIQYKNIQTGLTIFLFNINNIVAKNKRITTFNVDAYSYCPINSKLQFKILFDKNTIANCFFINSFSIVKKNSIIYKTKKILKAFCSVKKHIFNFNDYYFQFTNIPNIKIYNKRKYLTIIFKDFYCIKENKCTLISLFYKNRKKGYKIDINIFNNSYLCILNNSIIYLNDKVPVIGKFMCERKRYNDNIYNNNLIGGTPNNLIFKKKKINDIQNQFFISRIIINTISKKYTNIIIKGKLFDDLSKNIVGLRISAVYPKIYLICHLKKSSKYVQSNIHCITEKKINSEILIENKIIYNKDYRECLLLINQITLYQNYEIVAVNDILQENRNKYLIFVFYSYITIIILISLKYYLKRSYKKHIAFVNGQI